MSSRKITQIFIIILVDDENSSTSWIVIKNGSNLVKYPENDEHKDFLRGSAKSAYVHSHYYWYV